MINSKKQIKREAGERGPLPCIVFLGGPGRHWPPRPEATSFEFATICDFKAFARIGRDVLYFCLLLGGPGRGCSG